MERASISRDLLTDQLLYYFLAKMYVKIKRNVKCITCELVHASLHDDFGCCNILNTLHL